MYVADRQTDVRQKHRLMPPPYGGGGITRLSTVVDESNSQCLILLALLSYSISLSDLSEILKYD